MTSEIRANTLKNRVGLGTVSFTNTGPVVSGIVTIANSTAAGVTLEDNAGVGNSLKITTPTGYVSIGSGNSTFVHFNTDRGVYYFQKRIFVDEGIIGSYDENLVLHSPMNTTRVTINKDTGLVSIVNDLDVDGHTNLDNVSIAGVSTFSDHINLPDNKQIKFGGSSDFKIEHNTNENYIDSNSGHIYIRANVDDDEGDNIYIQAKSGENSIVCDDDGGVRLFYNNVEKAYTNSQGLYVVNTGSDAFFRLLAPTGYHARIDMTADTHANEDNYRIEVNTDQKFRVYGKPGGNYTSFIELDQAGQVTLTRDLDVARHLDVNGHTDLDNVSIAGITTISSNLVVSGQIFQSRPNDLWTTGSAFYEIAGLGNLTTQGSYETTLTSNGYRDTNGQWVSYATNSYTGASQIRLNPQGSIIFGAESSKSNGSTHVVTERLRIDQEGIRSPGGTFNIRNNNSTGNVTINVLGVSGDSRIDLENTGNGNYSGIDFIRERSSGTGVVGGSIFMKSDTSSNDAFLYIQAQSASAQSPVTTALSADNGVRLKLQGGDGIFAIETGASERLRIDSSGRIGIGCIPTAQFDHNLIQIGNQATLGANAALSTTGQTFLTHNLYFDPSGNYQVFNTSNANEGAILRLVDGNFLFSNSAQTTGTPTVVERLRINSDGDLMVGTTSDVSNVVAIFGKNHNNTTAISVENTNTNSSARIRYEFKNGSNTSYIEKYNSGGWYFFNGTPSSSNPNIGFYGSNSWISLRLRPGDVSNDIAEFYQRWGTSNGILMNIGSAQSGTAKAMRFLTSHYGGERGYIGVTLGGTSYNSSSDYRMKQDVVDLTGAIDRVKSFKPKRFKWKEDPTYTVDGFLAHEASTVVPESVDGEKDAVDSNGDPKHQVMDNSKLVPVLTAALKEAIAKIETLETKVAALESS